MLQKDQAGGQKLPGTSEYSLLLAILVQNIEDKLHWHALNVTADPELHVVSKEIPGILQRNIERHIAASCTGKHIANLYNFSRSACIPLAQHRLSGYQWVKLGVSRFNITALFAPEYLSCKWFLVYLKGPTFCLLKSSGLRKLRLEGSCRGGTSLRSLFWVCTITLSRPRHQLAWAGGELWKRGCKWGLS